MRPMPAAAPEPLKKPLGKLKKGGRMPKKAASTAERGIRAQGEGNSTAVTNSPAAIAPHPTATTNSQLRDRSAQSPQRGNSTAPTTDGKANTSPVAPIENPIERMMRGKKIRVPIALVPRPAEMIARAQTRGLPKACRTELGRKVAPPCCSSARNRSVSQLICAAESHPAFAELSERAPAITTAQTTEGNASSNRSHCQPLRPAI